MTNLFSSLDGLLWLVLMLLPLIFLQRWLHREIQAVFLILTRRPGVTQVLFALIFLPGVFLHEFSHFVMAKLLGVRTGRFSLLPQARPNGKLQLGYVETASGGVIKDALIGLAPLVSGCLFIACAAIFRMQLLPLWDMLRAGEFGLFWLGVTLLPKIGDFWLWFYLTFAVSSTMMPSASDRRAWLPLGLIIGGLFAVTLLAGTGPWMLENLAPPFNSFLRALAAIFGLSATVHIILILPFLVIHRILAKMTGVDIS